MYEENVRRKTRIVVVEDNPADIELLRWTLESAELDCELMVFEDGGEALNWIRQRPGDLDEEKPDLAILDLNVPKSDGLEVRQAMLENPSLAKVPVVILTSSSSPRERAKLAELPIARHLIKPMDFAEFMQIGLVLKEVLEEARAQDSSEE